MNLNDDPIAVELARIEADLAEQDRAIAALSEIVAAGNSEAFDVPRAELEQLSALCAPACRKVPEMPDAAIRC